MNLPQKIGWPLQGIGIMSLIGILGTMMHGISFWAFICGISIGAMIGILYMLFWGAP